LINQNNCCFYPTEFSFLNKHYNLLYQSLIPNCKLTIKILKQHLEITSDAERFIVSEDNLRVRCQRIINFLLVWLDTKRDYKQFCYLFNMITVMVDLPDKLRTGKLDLCVHVLWVVYQVVCAYLIYQVCFTKIVYMCIYLYVLFLSTPTLMKQGNLMPVWVL